MRRSGLPPRARLRSRRALLLPGALVALWACGRGAGAPDSSEAGGSADAGAVRVTVVRPERRTLTRSLSLPGTVEAIQEATLYAKVAGYLSKITVDRGDRVRRGQILAEISVPEMAGDRDVAEARLREAEAELELRRSTDARLEAVHQAEPGAVTQQQLDEAQAGLHVAEATVSRLRAELRRLEALIAYATLEAPFDGVVTDRFVDPGAFIQIATTSTEAPIVKVTNMDTVRVFVNVPEPEVPSITRSTPARLAVSALPGRAFAGSVTRYDAALDPSTRTMKTEIDVPNPGHLLRPGMYGQVALELARHEEALALSAGALVMETDSSFVYTVAEGRAKKVPIRTGLNDGIVVEILSGIKGDEQVIAGGKGLVRDGTLVAIGDSK